LQQLLLPLDYLSQGIVRFFTDRVNIERAICQGYAKSITLSGRVEKEWELVEFYTTQIQLSAKSRTADFKVLCKLRKYLNTMFQKPEIVRLSASDSALLQT
jgi:hypothetical protein